MSEVLAPVLSAGDAVEVVKPLLLHSHVAVGTRGWVLRMVEHGRLVEVQLDGERQPAVLRVDHVRLTPKATIGGAR